MNELILTSFCCCYGSSEYFERTILCNSLVWTCSLSGKTGLTYAEAVESEERAARLIENFPLALLRPILFLITLTRRGK